MVCTELTVSAAGDGNGHLYHRHLPVSYRRALYGRGRRGSGGGQIANGLHGVDNIHNGKRGNCRRDKFDLKVASFSQNVGIVTVNKVINRAVFAFSAGILLIAGLMPKFAYTMAREAIAEGTNSISKGIHWGSDTQGAFATPDKSTIPARKAASSGYFSAVCRWLPSVKM